MSILRVQHTENYSVISNVPLKDTRLSWEAKGLLAYLLSKPNHWQTRTQQLVSQSPAGEKKVTRIIAELKHYGYITRERVRTADGRWDWVTTIYETPELAALHEEKMRTIPPLRRHGDGGAVTAARSGGHIASTESTSTESTSTDIAASSYPSSSDKEQFPSRKKNDKQSPSGKKGNNSKVEGPEKAPAAPAVNEGLWERRFGKLTRAQAKQLRDREHKHGAEYVQHAIEHTAFHKPPKPFGYFITVCKGWETEGDPYERNRPQEYDEARTRAKIEDFENGYPAELERRASRVNGILRRLHQASGTDTTLEDWVNDNLDLVKQTGAEFGLVLREPDAQYDDAE